MIELNKISIKELTALIKIIGLSNSHEKEQIRIIYESSHSFYEDNLNLLEKLNLVRSKGKTLFLKNQIELSESSIRKELFKSVLKTGFELYEFQGFISNFTPEKDSYIFSPSFEERLKYSTVRNFLIELGIISYGNNNIYSINKRYFNLIKGYNKKLTKEMLSRLLSLNDKIGQEAEMLILSLERDKFKIYPKILKKIEHTSVIDETAGYDIRSYLQERDKFSEIFIEVKAVSLSDLSFVWSYNEIEKSKQLRHNYFLYLVPVMSKGKFDSSKIKIIRDPYLNVNLNPKWRSIVEKKRFFYQ